MDLEELENQTDAQNMEARIRADMVPPAAILGILTILQEKGLLDRHDFLRYEAASLEALEHLTTFASGLAKMALVASVPNTEALLESLEMHGFTLDGIKDDLEQSKVSMEWIAERYGRVFDKVSADATINLLVLIIDSGMEELREAEALKVGQ